MVLSRLFAIPAVNCVDDILSVERLETADSAFASCRHLVALAPISKAHGGLTYQTAAKAMVSVAITSTLPTKGCTVSTVPRLNNAQFIENNKKDAITSTETNDSDTRLNTKRLKKKGRLLRV